MRIIHIVFESATSQGSGAPIRNNSIGLGLSRIAQFSTIVVQNYFTSDQAFPDRKPSYIEANLPENVVEDIVTRVQAAGCDLVIVEGVFLADICKRLIDVGENVIIDMHNIESALLRENELSKYGWFGSLIKSKRWKRAEAAEKAIVEKVKEVWVCSKSDAELLKTISDTPPTINILPNPIPAWCSSVEPPSRNADWTIKLLFVGHLRYRPNIRAIRRLLQSIFPAIRETFPDAELTICGRNPSKKLRRMADRIAGVKLVGDPVDLRPYYAVATIVAAPLTEGGGTRIKILEAISMGLPIIATPKAVEGLELVSNEMFLEANDDSDLIAAIRKLANDKVLRHKLVNTSQSFISRNYAQDIIDQALVGLVERK